MKINHIDIYTNNFIRSIIALPIKMLDNGEAYICNNTLINSKKNEYNSEVIIYHIDACEQQNDLIYVKGWAMERHNMLPPAAIIVLDDNDFLLGYLDIFTPRKDVHSALAAQVEQLGFALTFEPPMDAKHIRIFALLHDRSLVLLKELAIPREDETVEGRANTAASTRPVLRFNEKNEITVGASPLLYHDTAKEGLHYHLDEMYMEDDMFFVRGWCADQANSIAPDVVFLANDYGSIISITASLHARPDVANALGITICDNFGFILQLPKQFSDDGLHLYAANFTSNILTKLTVL